MKRIILLVTFVVLVIGCATHNKIKRLYKDNAKVLALVAKENDVPIVKVNELVRDTLLVQDAEGKDVLIMKAVKDENGEMVANDVIRAAKVTARFRNVAERNGKVDLMFDVNVAPNMIDSDWQLRLYPNMKILGDSLQLDPILITGKDYRKAQLKGYQQYNKFLQSIVADSAKFLMSYQLEMFIERNLPELYKFKHDSTFVSDEKFASCYGVTEKQAIEHYSNRYIIRRNIKKISLKKAMYKKYIKVPIISNGLRLDTVLANGDKGFIYRYVQTINTKPKLKKAEITLHGSIYVQDKQIYKIPYSEPLSFYISSLSSFADNREKYLKEIISRRAVANSLCYIDFYAGQTKVIPTLSHNASEIKRIYNNLKDLASNEKFDLDSIIVVASCSPEGTVDYNNQLSLNRAEAVSVYFKNKIKHIMDSINTDRGLYYDYAGVGYKKPRDVVKFIYKNNSENWCLLDKLVEKDTVLSNYNKMSYKDLNSIANLDTRELALSKTDYYKYIREHLYPRLRTVQFEFYMHRKDMIKDTVHTTILDTTYMKGVQALNNRDYMKAIEILRPYRDFNTALAYCAMSYNESALSILEEIEPNDKILYMKAIIYSRKGMPKKAIECYLQACNKNKTFISRGNLDPEISVLIKNYNLNKDL